jgi:hypothetical protein
LRHLSGEFLKGNNRKFMNRAVALFLVWILLLALSLSFLSFLVDLFQSNPQSQSFTSLSWAGYAVSDDFAVPPLEVRSISASWTVPAVSGSLRNAFSSAWVGLGGQTDNTLIQAGTEQDLVNGQVTYYAWYEMLPDYAVVVTDITVSPGDVIAASVALVDSSANKWLIQISDATNGQAFSKNVVYNSSRSSGEWILERPSVNNKIAPLSDFGNITFQDCSIKVNNSVGPISQFKYSQVRMANQGATPLTSVSAISADGLSFTVSYLGSN